MMGHCEINLERTKRERVGVTSTLVHVINTKGQSLVHASLSELSRGHSQTQTQPTQIKFKKNVEKLVFLWCDKQDASAQEDKSKFLYSCPDFFFLVLGYMLCLLICAASFSILSLSLSHVVTVHSGAKK